MEIKVGGSRARIVGRAARRRYVRPALATERRCRLRRAALQSRSAGRRDARGRSAAAPPRATRRACHAGDV